MRTENLRKRKPGDLKDYDQGRKFDKLYDGIYVYGDKLTEEKRSEINQNADQINEAYVSLQLLHPLISNTVIATTTSSQMPTKMAGATNSTSAATSPPNPGTLLKPDMSTTSHWPWR